MSSSGEPCTGASAIQKLGMEDSDTRIISHGNSSQESRPSTKILNYIAIYHLSSPSFPSIPLLRLPHHRLPTLKLHLIPPTPRMPSASTITPLLINPPPLPAHTRDPKRFSTLHTRRPPHMSLLLLLPSSLNTTPDSCTSLLHLILYGFRFRFRSRSRSKPLAHLRHGSVVGIYFFALE